MTITVRILVYGCAADHYDEYIKIGEGTAIKCLKAFCNAIVAVYADEYMHPPNEADTTWLLEEGQQRGFLGYKKPIVTKDGVTIEKEESEWTQAENNAQEGNTKAFFSLLKSVVQSELARIAHYTIIKETWDILQLTHEGTDEVKSSKNEMLVFQFENLKMEEDETFSEFYMKLNHIMSGLRNLGKKVTHKKINKKILRFLLERFRIKVETLQATQNIIAMYDSESDDEITLITKKFINLIKSEKMNAFKKGGESRNKESLSRGSGRQDKRREDESKRIEIKCWTCGGIGHTSTVCPSPKNCFIARKESKDKNKDDSDFKDIAKPNDEKFYMEATKENYGKAINELYVTYVQTKKGFNK
ncbi:uncharacterized protein LOC132309237 [Cornus florida]|uniref:uncharacterized protein LOC132309237 n=1 Tax=Cornus florida TaxID=4283 RepID=UPI00289A0C57|nr:uncharacterized protein LOC132309237 [Cornus florida]